MTIINIQMASEIPDTFKATFCYLLLEWGHHKGCHSWGGAWHFQDTPLPQRTDELELLELAWSLLVRGVRISSTAASIRTRSFGDFPKRARLIA